MATKKKQDWIDDIVALDKEHEGLLGEIPVDELVDFTVGQLKALHKDMADEIAEQNVPATVPDDDKDNDDKEDSPSPFITMCGSEFNPKKSGECFKQCQIDFPEAFTACIEQYKKTEIVTKKTKTKSTIGKTEWGHLKTAQGGLIDEFFFNGNVGTIKDICEFSGGKDARCMHHMKHLVADKGVEILYSFKKVEEEKDGNKSTSQEKVYWWADKDKRRKGDKLEGKSAYNK